MNQAFMEDTTGIEAAAVSYLTAFNRGDAAAVLSTYADDGVLMAPGRPATVGKSSLAKAYPGIFEEVGFDMKYEIKEAVQTSEDWGFVRSTTEGTLTVKATGEAHRASYQELFLLRRSADGVWQIARYCTVNVAP